MDPARREVFIEQLEKNGSVEEFETVFFNNSHDKKRNLVLSGRRITYENEAAFLVIYKDITNFVLSTQELKKEGDDLKLQAAANNVILGLSETKINGLINTKTQGILVHSNREILFSNDELAKIIDFNEDNIMALDDIFDLCTPKDWDRVADIHEVFEKEFSGVLGFNFQGATRAGESIFLNCKSQVIDWDDGPAILTCVTDITEETLREQALERANSELENQIEKRGKALQDMENLFSSFIENCPLPINVKDRSRRILHVNTAGWTNFNLKPDEAGEDGDLSRVFGAEATKILEDADTYIFETGQPFGIVDRIIFPVGEKYFRIFKFPIQDSDGNVKMIGSIAVDATQGQDYQDELAETVELLDGILQSSPVGIGISERFNGSIKYANSRHAEILGATREQLEGQSTERF